MPPKHQPPSRAVPCDICGQMFFPASLKFHKKTCKEKQEKMIMACPYCGEEMPMAALDGHIKKCKVAIEQMQQRRRSSGVTCEDASGATVLEMSGPIRMPDGRMRCPFCDRGFSADRIHKHMSICGKLKKQAKTQASAPEAPAQTAPAALPSNEQSLSLQRPSPSSSKPQVRNKSPASDNKWVLREANRELRDVRSAPDECAMAFRNFDPPVNSGNWRAKHKEVIAAIRNARRVAKHEGNGFFKGGNGGQPAVERDEATEAAQEHAASFPTPSASSFVRREISSSRKSERPLPPRQASQAQRKIDGFDMAPKQETTQRQQPVQRPPRPTNSARGGNSQNLEATVEVVLAHSKTRRSDSPVVRRASRPCFKAERANVPAQLGRRQSSSSSAPAPSIPVASNCMSTTGDRFSDVCLGPLLSEVDELQAAYVKTAQEFEFCVAAISESVARFPDSGEAPSPSCRRLLQSARSLESHTEADSTQGQAVNRFGFRPLQRDVPMPSPQSVSRSASCAYSQPDWLKDEQLSERTDVRTLDWNSLSELGPGSTVQVHGLSTASHLNGLSAVLLSFDVDAKCWMARLDNGKMKALRSENISSCNPPTLSSSYLSEDSRGLERRTPIESPRRPLIRRASYKASAENEDTSEASSRYAVAKVLRSHTVGHLDASDRPSDGALSMRLPSYALPSASRAHLSGATPSSSSTAQANGEKLSSARDQSPAPAARAKTPWVVRTTSPRHSRRPNGSSPTPSARIATTPASTQRSSYVTSGLSGRQIEGLSSTPKLAQTLPCRQAPTWGAPSTNMEARLDMLRAPRHIGGQGTPARTLSSAAPAMLSPHLMGSVPPPLRPNAQYT